jgi:hypothetical protein
MAQTIRVLGIGIAKLVCHVVGLDDTGHVVLRKRLARREWRHFMASCPRSAWGWKRAGVRTIGLDVSANMGTTCG